MKYDSILVKIKVLMISFVIVGLEIYGFITDKSLEWGTPKITSIILCVLWGFFFPPTVKYIINWFKTCSAQEAFYVGYKIGLYGIFVIVLIDPFVGMMYLLNKRFTKHNGSGHTIMVGFYLD